MNDMKVAKTKRIFKKIGELLEIRAIERNIGLLLDRPIALDTIVFDDIDSLLGFAEFFKKNMSQFGFRYTDDESIMAGMVMSVIGGLDKVGESLIPPDVFHAIIKESHMFHVGEIKENPYMKNITLDGDVLSKRFKLSHAGFEAFEMFHYSTPVRGPYGIMIPRIGAADHPFSAINILEDVEAWMSVTPNEMVTMDRPITEAHGKVLTLGCGLGYYAYMVSLKEDVETVTIIERSDEVIDLFKEHILPQFEHREKISVIKADAFDYIRDLNDGAFDYCFADIWKNNLEPIPYLKMKQLCRKFRAMKMSYWIEDSIVASLMCWVSIIIMDSFYEEMGMTGNADAVELKRMIREDLTDEERAIFLFMRKILANEEITRPEQIDWYMDYRNIIHLFDKSDVLI